MKLFQHNQPHVRLEEGQEIKNFGSWKLGNANHSKMGVTAGLRSCAMYCFCRVGLCSVCHFDVGPLVLKSLIVELL